MQSQADHIYRIKCAGDAAIARGEQPTHPDYPAIRDAAHQFIEEPLIAFIARTGRYPDRLVYPPPRTPIEAACQWVAVTALQKSLGRPIAIHHTHRLARAPHRLRHAFRVARRALCHRF